MAFKVGDRVRCVNIVGSNLNLREVYTVRAENCGHYVVDDTSTYWIESRFVLADDLKPIMVPVDPACVPDGWEAVRVGHPRKGEHWVSSVVNVGCDEKHDSLLAVCLIVRKKYVASVSIPKDWWVMPSKKGDTWFATENKPEKNSSGNWSAPGIYISISGLNFTPPEDGQPRQVT